MSSTSFSLTGEQRNALHAAVEAPALAPDFARTGEANPHLRVFAVHFDGTNNDRDNIPEGQQTTLVDDSFMRLRDADNPAIESRYYHGVGTGPSGLRRVMELAFGVGCERNAERAHADLVKQVAEWRREDPDVEVHVHVVGFSRGSASALHFLNLVDERGAISSRQNPETVPQQLRPGEVVSSTVLYDTVSTGQGLNLNLAVPRSCAAALHLTAGGEERTMFPLRKIADRPDLEVSVATNVNMHGCEKDADGSIRYQRIQNVDLPGARHSDVGGSYIGGGIREVSGYLADTFQASLGLPVQPVRPSFELIQEAEFHDSRWVKIGNELEDRQASERETRRAHEIEWDGRYALNSSIKGLPEGSSEAEVGRGASVSAINRTQMGMADGWDTFSDWLEDNLAGETDLTARFSLKSGSDAKPHGSLALNLDAGDSFWIEEDRLLFQGQPVPGLPPVSQIHEHLLAQRASGVDQEPVEVNMGLRQVGMVSSTKQLADAPAPAPIDFGTDPWPAELRECLKVLNTKPQLTAADASEMMNRSMHSVAQTLQSEFDIEAVAIKPKLWLERHSAGMLRVNSFEISCERDGDSPFTSDTPASGMAQASMAARLREMSKALNRVSQGLREHGFKPDKACAQRFEPGAEMAGCEVQSMCDFDPNAAADLKVSPTTVRTLNTLWRFDPPAQQAKRDRPTLKA